MVQLFSSKPTLVRLGAQNLANSNDTKSIELKIKLIFYHGRYSTKTKKNDIALLELESAVDFTAYIRPACLYQEPDFNGSVIAVRGN